MQPPFQPPPSAVTALEFCMLSLTSSSPIPPVAPDPVAPDPADAEHLQQSQPARRVRSSRLKVEEPFLKRLTEQVMGKQGQGGGSADCGKRLNFKDLSDLSAILKRLWGGLKSKFKIQLPWPSCRIAGIADFQFLLGECEVFLKVKLPTYFDWNCTACGKTSIKNWRTRGTRRAAARRTPCTTCTAGPWG